MQQILKCLQNLEKNAKKKHKKESTKEKIKGEFQKPLWFEIRKAEFKELTDDIYNNQDKKEFKTTVNKRTYDLKNEKTWTKVTTSQISKNEAKKLYEELIQKDTDALTRKKVMALRNTIF